MSDMQALRREELEDWNKSPLKEVVQAMKLTPQTEEVVRRAFRMGWTCGRIKVEQSILDNTPTIRAVTDEEN